MKVIAERFVRMAHANGVSLAFIARELGMTVERLRKQLAKGEIFTYEESRLLMAMFGAEAMLPVIDWREVNVCRTAG